MIRSDTAGWRFQVVLCGESQDSNPASGGEELVIDQQAEEAEAWRFSKFLIQTKNTLSFWSC